MAESGHTRVRIDEEALRRCLSSECSFCRENCSSYRGFQLETYSSRGKNRVLKGYADGEFTDDDLIDLAYTCTLCGQCKEVCLTDGGVYEQIMDIRKSLVKRGSQPSGLQEFIDLVMENRTPYDTKDTNWYNKEKALEKGKIAYFPGCAIQALFPDVASKTMKLLESIGIEAVPISIHCCGSPALGFGFIEQAKTIAQDFANDLEYRKVRTVITSCPGCTETLRTAFPELTGSRFKVLHITEVLAKHLKKIRGSFKSDKIIYHDPCKLSRKLDIIEEPRRILAGIGSQVKEFNLSKKETSCCGGGGGFYRNYPDESFNVARMRIREAVELGADKIVTTCPTCRSMFLNASNGDIEIVDIVDLIVA